MIKQFLDADHDCGSPVAAVGIPVMEQGYRLKGASAVIEKDLGLDFWQRKWTQMSFCILTDVPNVYVNYGKEDQKALETLSVQEAKN